MVESGTLYGVGVGPGDPELMTVKAWRLISTARVIAYLAANGGESTARDIARPFLPEYAQELIIDMPMQVEREPGERAYDAGADAIASHLRAGRDVVMLCEGDPFFYGSFIHVFSRLAAEFPVKVVPGVTSIAAAAAVTGRPLASRNDVVKVVPATLPPPRLRAELEACDSAAVIKVGRHFGKVRQVLDGLGLSSRAIAIVRATHDDQEIRAIGEIDGDALPYFTTILVRSGR